MKKLLTLALCVLMSAPIGSLEANNFSDRPSYSITKNAVTVAASALDAGRVRKQVSFRGNKSARFAEFENLGLAPQQLYAKGLLNSAVAIDTAGVVNYAALPDVNVATAVERVETKVTKRVANNPAIAGYGRTTQNIYGALAAKRAKDARTNAALAQKLDKFQVRAGRMQEKIRRANSNTDALIAALNQKN